LQLPTSTVEVCFNGYVKSLFGKKARKRIYVHGLDHVGRQVRHGKGLRYHTDTPFAFAASIQQCTLHRHNRTVQILLIVDQIKGEGGISVAIGQCQQIRSANEEIPIKVGDTHATCATDAHDSLKGRGLGQ